MNQHYQMLAQDRVNSLRREADASRVAAVARAATPGPERPLVHRGPRLRSIRRLVARLATA